MHQTVAILFKRMVARIASVTLAGILLSCTSTSRTVDVPKTAVLSPDGGTCIDCAGTPGVLAAVAKRDQLQIPRWLQEQFEPFGRFSEHYKAAPLEEIQLDFSALVQHPNGLKFSANGVSFRYWNAECRVFDCYRPHIERLDDNDQVVWRRRVPFLEVPVFPFFVEDHLIYIGHHGEPQLRLIILDATDGKITREWLLPEGLSPINPVSTYPFMSDEYLFIQPCTVDWPDIRSSDSRVVTPQEILAYQLAF